MKKPHLLITKIVEPLGLDEGGCFPKAWTNVDRLSNGLLSRFLWLKKSKDRSALSNLSHQVNSTKDDDLSNWVLLQPFNPKEPIWLAVWNSSQNIDMKSLALKQENFEKIYFDDATLGPADVKTITALCESAQSFGS